MLNSLWANAPGRRCIAAIRGKTTQHYWFDSNEEALEKAIELDKAGYNVYFSPALYDPENVDRRRSEINPRTGRHYSGREQGNVSYIPALWIDLDCGEGKDYPDLKAGFSAFNEWLQTSGVLPPTFIVCSGYGLHVYWQLTQPVPHRQWTPVAQHLKQACRIGGLAADPARTSDSASLLRVPGTTNRKNRQEAPVKVLGSNPGGRVDLMAFRASLPVVGPQGAVPASSPLGEWDVTPNLPPGDAEKIADKCQQMGLLRFNLGAVSEPHWRAGLSILHRCEGGETLIHEWSKGDKRYDYQQTIAKAEGTKGPATCRHFLEVNPEGCQGCPHAGQITSPINLAFAQELPTTEEGEEADSVPGYTITREGVFKEPLSDDGGPLTKIADFPVWIEEAREVAQINDRTMRSTLLIGWEDLRGKRYRAPLAQADLHDKRQWMTWLADNNLASFVKGPLMAQFISQMHRARYKRHGSRVVYECLGWYEDHSMFVLGNKAVTKEGWKDTVIDTRGPIAHLSPAGELQDWLKGIAVLGYPKYSRQAFGLLVGFAAPLLSLVGREGAVVAMTGRSGFGKSMAAMAGLSIYVNPKTYQISGGSTTNGWGRHLAESRHVPALIDEITGVPENRLRDLIYMAANGAEKTTMTQRRERRAAMTWQTVTMLTSNHSIIERQQKDIEEAHRRRLVEVPVLTIVSDKDGEAVYQAILNNHGVAALPYLQTVIKYKKYIPELFRLMEKQVREWGYNHSADRFGSWTCAAALLGGILARLAGVLPFDPLPVVKDIVQIASEANDAILAPEDHAKDALFEMLVTESRRICIWANTKIAKDDVDDPVARVNGDELFVRAKDLHDCWTEEKIFIKGIEKWMKEVSPAGRMKYRLAPGTPPVWCYKFDMDKLGWSLYDIKRGDE